jgi:flagellar assembly protein FliH
MATIIRKDNPVQAPSGQMTQAISFSFADMHGQANEYLGTVRAEAAKIVQQANQQAEQIRKQAEVAGRKAAEAAIEKALEQKLGQQMQTLLPTIERLVTEVNELKGELLAEWERSTVKVSTAIAERIIRREVKLEPQITLDLVSESLRLATGAAEITVHVSPSDYEHLGSQVESVAAALAQLAPSEIVADETVSPGGCLVTTRYGEIDQRIESQLKRIEEELT